MKTTIPLARPSIATEELEAVEEVMRSGNLAQGREVAHFERLFADYIGAKSAVAVCNGTVALDLALKAIDIKPGDEVLTTSFSFISTANSILFQGAKPVFADIDRRSFNIDPNDAAAKISRKTKAIIGVHLFGHPFDLTTMREICHDNDLFLIEDCAQAHGAEYDKKKVGSFGFGCFSFYATKNMTTGEGGMITTELARVADVCRLLRDHGQSSRYVHTILGYNYRMTDLEAAIGRIQLEKIDELNKKRAENARYFNTHINLHGLSLPHAYGPVTHVYHQYVVTTEEDVLDRDMLVKYLNEKGVGCGIHYPSPIFRQPLYRRLGFSDETVNCPAAIDVADRVLSLPIYPTLTNEELQYIVRTINDFPASG